MRIGRAEAGKLGREDFVHGMVGRYNMRYGRCGKDAGSISTGDRHLRKLCCTQCRSDFAALQID